jgi:hypothetical protein
MQNLHRFYENEVDTAGLWYLQFLLVISFGKAFLVRIEAIVGMPIPGSEYFIRAMKMMPDVMNLHQDPILAIEILCLVSLSHLTAGGTFFLPQASPPKVPGGAPHQNAHFGRGPLEG